MNRSASLASALAVALAACACSASGWNEPVRTWGSMHAIMHDGETQGRVRLADASASPRAVGIGALAELSGEIVILDGQVWTSRVEAAPRIDTGEGARPTDEAALLAVTDVSRWSERTLDRDLTLEELDASMRRMADESGLTRAETIPFLVHGELDALDAHVLNGRCPYAGPGSSEADPVRSSVPRANGMLVGFYTELPPGLITHRGSHIHVHVLIRGDAPFVGHVDSVRIRRGATLSLPLGR